MNTSVKSARRVLEILELFASTGRALALRDVAALLGLPKSSAHMLLATLEQRGYLVREPGDRFMLLPALRASGGWVGGMTGQIFRAAHPVMDALLERFDETVVLGAPTPGLDVRIVSHRPSQQAIRYDVSRDPVLPGYCTAMGHAVLCHLPEDEVRAYLARTEMVAMTAATLTEPEAIIARLRQCRAQGYATNIDERFEGASGMAVAIRGPDGRPHAALNIVTVTPRFHRRRDEFAPALIEAARGLEETAFGPLPRGKPERRLSA
ncbi:MAG TPA: IclR family transcriptional regulator [Thermohalobaculum sp.]|nr:IclR family transcriptional regulator [Thermohalobaculum sp.]